MKHLISIFLLFSVIHVNAQIQFIGFDHASCPQQLNFSYTFNNYSIGGGGSGTVYGYDILRNGVVVFSHSGQMGNGKQCLDLVFINDSVGFLVYYSGLSYNRVLRTEDYGVTWNDIGGGAPNYFGLYVVNPNVAYLVTQWNTPLQLHVARCSSIPGNMDPLFIYDLSITSDVFTTDTLLSSDLCNIDSLRIYVLNGTDTVTYHINYLMMSAGLGDSQESSPHTLVAIPNPATGTFNVSLPYNVVKTVSLYALNGELIKSYLPRIDDAQQYSMENVPDGMYMLKVTDGHGEVYTSKLVVLN